MFERIIYVSKASNEITLRDVYDIIRKSHNRNSDAGLTGGLLYLEGYFVQLLEGSPHSVKQRYRSILADKRHHDVELRLSIMSKELLFPNEWMALREQSSLPDDVLQRHHYEPGLPVDRFDADAVLAFLLDCFNLTNVNHSVLSTAV